MLRNNFKFIQIWLEDYFEKRINQWSHNKGSQRKRFKSKKWCDIFDDEIFSLFCTVFFSTIAHTAYKYSVDKAWTEFFI